MNYANVRIYFRNRLLKVLGADAALDITNQPYSWMRSAPSGHSWACRLDGKHGSQEVWECSCGAELYGSPKCAARA